MTVTCRYVSAGAIDFYRVSFSPHLSAGLVCWGGMAPESTLNPLPKAFKPWIGDFRISAALLFSSFRFTGLWGFFLLSTI